MAAMKYAFLLAFVSATAVGLVTAIGQTPEDKTEPAYEAVTKPSKEVRLSLVQSGRIKEVAIKDGDRVQTGDVLVRLDDEVEKLALQQLKAQAENDTTIQAAEAQLEQSKVDLQRVEDLGEKDVATKYEIEHARLDKLIAELRVKLSTFELNISKIKYEEARTHLDRMILRSPIDGVVAQVIISAGESIEAYEKIVHIVKLDPLWVDVPVPLAKARGLELQAPAVVHFHGPGPAIADGTIIHKAPVADARSGTLMVRVEFLNPSLRPAGEPVRVSFPAGGNQE